MKVNRNQIDVDMLQADPAALLTHYQPVIAIVVSKLLSRGYFEKDEKMEIIQLVNTAMLEKKLNQIKRNYNGSVLLSTYFSKVVYNHCLEIARRRKKHPKLQSEQLLHYQKDQGISVEDQLVIKDEITRLHVILKGVIGLSARTLLALKLFARVLVRQQDFYSELYPLDETIQQFEKTFSADYSELNDKEVYQLASPFLNKITGKKIDSDSLRKWINLTVDRIVELLNGVPPRSAYERETVKILLQLYFEQEKKSD